MAKPRMRLAWVVGSVLLAHLAVLWALQNGLLHRAEPVLVPVTLVSELLQRPAPGTPPKPAPSRVTSAKLAPAKPQVPAAAQAAPPAPSAAPATSPAPDWPKLQVAATTATTATTATAVTPAVAAVAPDPVPAARAPTGVALAAAALAATAPQAVPTAGSAHAAVSTSTSTSTSTVAPALPSPPAAPKLELPSSEADFLHNPRPDYPPLSKSMREQGKVLVRVLIGVDGTAKQAEIQKSSGFNRLDQAALATVQRWRYVPGKRAGVPEAMWFTVPLTFVLE